MQRPHTAHPPPQTQYISVTLHVQAFNGQLLNDTAHDCGALQQQSEVRKTASQMYETHIICCTICRASHATPLTPGSLKHKEKLRKTFLLIES